MHNIGVRKYVPTHAHRHHTDIRALHIMARHYYVSVGVLSPPG